MKSFKEIQTFMHMAQVEAESAKMIGEVPVGCVIVTEHGEVIAATHNKKETTQNPCGHAEILALTEAGKKISSWRLTNCSLFVTLEPCPMCMGALVHARIKSLFFGAYDVKGGAISLGYNYGTDSKLNHKLSIMGGINHYDNSRMLSQFFRERRSNYK